MKLTARSASRFLPFVGAAIVLVTFAVKDVMSERLKSRSDAMNSAQTFYFSQTYDVFIEDDLNYLKQEVDLTKSLLDTKAGSDGRADATIAIGMQSSADHLLSVMQYVQNLSSLVAKVPDEASRLKQVSTLYKDCSLALAKVKAIQAQRPSRVATIRRTRAMRPRQIVHSWITLLISVSLRSRRPLWRRAPR